MKYTGPNRQLGISLIELMIAVALSLLLLLGVTQIFLSSKQTYTLNNSMSRIQESGRFALDFIAQDIRNAGYKGQCLGAPLEHLPSGHNTMWTLAKPIEGWNDITSKPAHLARAPVNGTDAIFIAFAAGSEDIVAEGTNSDGIVVISLEMAAAVETGAVTLISSAIGCDLFINTSTSPSSLTKNNASKWSHSYTDELEVLPLQNATYYVGLNDAGNRSLFRERLLANGGAPAWSDPEELVEGIDDMQILYGVAGANRQVNNYVSADGVTNWENVVAVRVELLAVGRDQNVLPENQEIDFNGSTVEIDNRRLAQVFTTTIGIRNRLP